MRYNKTAMIIFLYGPDSYRSHQKLQQITKRYVDTSLGDTNLAQLEGRELTALELKRQIQTLPFLANSRLVVVRNLLSEGKKEVMEGTIELLEAVPKSTVLLFYEGSQPDKRLKLFTALNKPKQAQEFALLEAAALTDHIIAEAENRGLKLSAQLANQLAQYAGSDLWRVTNELEKLSLYAQATQQKPTAEIIDQLVNDASVPKIFDLTDALGKRQSDQALKILNKTDEEGSFGLLAMIASHFRNLLLIADGQRRNEPRDRLAKTLGLHSFVFDKAYQQAQGYSYEELTDCYRYLFQLDLGAKQSIIEPFAGLTVLAAAVGQRPLQLPNIELEDMVQ